MAKKRGNRIFLPTQYYFHLAFLQNIELVQKEKKSLFVRLLKGMSNGNKCLLGFKFSLPP